MRTFAEQEQNCGIIFSQGGPYWHLCTPGQFTELLFKTEEDYKFIMNSVAIFVAAHPINIITFQIMSNHLHFILEGKELECRIFFEAIKKRLKRYFTLGGRFVDLQNFECEIIPINDLKTIRVEIVYVNRNGYLAQPNYTPYSYPWGSSNLYFGYPQQINMYPCYSTLPDLTKRALCKGRPVKLPEGYRVYENMILPSGYCNISKGQALFRDAHQYFNLLSKNYEAYSEIAKRLGDSVFLSDDEMFACVIQLARKSFGNTRPSMLPIKDKLSLARTMRSDYNASEGQIQRMLRLDRQVVYELFGRPLKA